MAQRGNIKSGGGSNVRSAIYPEMGREGAGKKFLSRSKPFRGPKYRSKGSSR